MTSMNQAKLRILKQEMLHLNIVVLEVNKLEWTELRHFQSKNYKVTFSVKKLQSALFGEWRTEEIEFYKVWQYGLYII